MLRILFIHEGIYDVEMSVKQLVNPDPETPQINQTQSGNGKNDKWKTKIEFTCFVLRYSNHYHHHYSLTNDINLTAAMFFHTEKCLSLMIYGNSFLINTVFKNNLVVNYI